MKLRALYGKSSIRKKMYLIIVPAIIILTTVFMMVFNSMLGDLQRFVIEKNSVTLSLIHTEIEDELSGMKNASSQIAQNSYVMRYASASATESDKQALQSVMTRNVFRDLQISLDIDVTNFMIVVDRDNYVSMHLSEAFTADERARLAAYVYDYSRTASGAGYVSLPEDLREVFGGPCYVLPLADMSSGHSGSLRVGGYLVLIVSRYFLSKIAAKYYVSGRTFLVSDESNDVIWTNSQKQFVPELLRGNTGSGNTVMDVNGVPTLVVYDHLSDVNWNISYQIPMSAISSQLRGYHVFGMAAILVAAALSLLLTALLSRSITSRLSKMVSVINSIKDGDIDCRCPVTYQDEISLIGSEFNGMMDQIRDLHLNAAKLELRQKEAELHALQSQINPHFLYNSLDCIRSSALVSNDTRAAYQTEILASMFRYTVSGNITEFETVTIDAELTHVYNYLTMLGFRFGDRYDVSVGVSERILPLKILKLTLQPLVENAFVHGVRDMASGGKVSISGDLDGDGRRVALRVEDNGAGIAPEQLARLKELLAANPLSVKETPFMSLVNINDRIRIAYGPEYGVSLESEPGNGTAVELRFPALEAQGGGKGA